MSQYHLVTGLFEILSHNCGCGENKGSKYHFITKNETLDLAFEDDYQALATPVNIPISLSISKEPLSGGCYLVNPEIPWYFKLPVEAAQIEYINGKIKKHIALIGALKSSDDVNSTNYKNIKKKITKWAEKIETFYRSYAGHKWDVRCEPFVIFSECQPSSPEFCSFEYRTWAKENPSLVPDNFNPNYFHWVGGFSQVCGLARLDGHASATYTGGYHVCGIQSAIHEIGHNFGLMHANRSGQEYEDSTSVMGKKGSSSSLNAPNLLYLNLHDSKREIFIDKTQQVQLAAIELENLALNENEKQYIILDKKTFNSYLGGYRKLIISARKDVGHTYSSGTGTPFGEGGEPTIHIHEVYASESNFLGYLRGLNNPQRFDELGLTVEIIDYDNEKYLLNFVFDGDSTPTEKMKKGFPKAISGVEVAEKHTGLWYDTRHPGQGLNLHVKNNRFTLCWYTFDYDSPPYANSPLRRFYIGTGYLNANGPEEFDIITTEKPYYGDNANKIIEKTIGRGRLYFIDEKNGVFDYNTSELGRGSIHLTPLLFSNNKNNGLWYNPNEKLTGFSINFYGKNDENCVAYWYDYGRRWGGANGPAGTQKFTDYNTVQRWYQCLGHKIKENEYKFKLQEIHQGFFRNSYPIKPIDVGEATMKFLNEKIEFTYNLQSYYKEDPLETDVKKNGTVTLSRLF
jgi:hypothetical protein